ncbi:PAS domain-containing protein [Bradyrhizobium sp. 13971]
MVMANKKSAQASAKFNSEMFADVPVLQRKWQAAVRPGERLPHYEDVMLGSLGRLADHIVLLRSVDGMLSVSHAGRYVQTWLNDERRDIPLSALPPDCATALTEAAANARENCRPYLASAHCVRDGLVRTFDVLALPTRSRWGGILVGVYVNERNAQYNLLDTIFSAADEGVLSLAAIRDARGEPADFQIVHLNQGAARLPMQPATDLLWRRLSAGGNPLAAPAVMSRLRGFVGGGPGGQFEIDSGDRCLRLGVTAFGDMLSLTVSDVTALKQRELSFRLLFENNPMPMWVFDAGTMEFLSVNDAAVQHYGYSREKFLGTDAAPDLAGGRMERAQRRLARDRRRLSIEPRLAAHQGRRQRDPCADLRTQGGVRGPRRLSGRGGRHHRAPRRRSADRAYGAP